MAQVGSAWVIAQLSLRDVVMKISNILALLVFDTVRRFTLASSFAPARNN